MKLNSLIWIGIFSFVSSVAFSMDVLTLGTGHYVSVESNIVQKDKPVFVLLPGIYRALDQRDAFIQKAIKQKINFISIHTSLHPDSIKEIPQNEKPYFLNKKITAKDLAHEVEAIIAYYEIQQPILVSLSYSSVISSELAQTGKYPLLIETAPMIRSDESNPSGGQLTDFWKNYLAMIPAFGSFWRDMYLNQIYTYYWTKELGDILYKYPDFKTADQQSLLIKSFTALSIAADGFDYSKQTFSSDVKRIYILGKSEDENRFELQKKSILRYQQETGHDKNVIMLDAGHIVPTDAPDAYVKTLKQLL